MSYLRKILVAVFLIPMAMVVLTEPLLGLQTSQSILSRGTIVYGQPSKVVFRETCDTWNATKWSSYGNRPDVVNGTWVFKSSAGSSQANFLGYSGYGTYKVRLRTSGPRVAGVNYGFFLYYAPHGDWQPDANELDFMEIWGHQSTGTYTITFYRNGTGGGKAGMMNLSYWYINTINRVGINWEDGNWHIVESNYSANDVIIYLDGAKIFQWSLDCRDTSQVYIPLPPMQFMIGQWVSGSTSSFSFIIDEIQYQT